MSLTQLKAGGKRVRVNLAKVLYITELNSGTELTFNDGQTLDVEESYQTVSNRAAKADTDAPEAAAAE